MKVYSRCWADVETLFFFFSPRCLLSGREENDALSVCQRDHFSLFSQGSVSFAVGACVRACSAVGFPTQRPQPRRPISVTTSLFCCCVAKRAASSIASASSSEAVCKAPFFSDESRRGTCSIIGRDGTREVTTIGYRKGFVRSSEWTFTRTRYVTVYLNTDE